MTPDGSALPRLAAELPEYLSELALAVASSLNVDFGMALTTLLSGMASAAHGVRAVRRPDGDVEPLALFCVVLSDSGTGKTRTHKLVHSPHRAHDAGRYHAYQDAKQGGSRAQLRDVLQPLINNRFLLKSLEGVGQATAISAHEGKTLLNSHFFRYQLDLANVLWDGDDKITLPLSSGERLIALDASLNILVMAQHDVFRDYLAKHGAMARSVGFLPRCLFTRAMPVRRSLRRPPVPACMHEYYKDATAYLDLQRDQQEAPVRELIDFSPAAAGAWFRIQEELDRSAVFQYPGAGDAVARALQNVARVAGVIHCYYPRRLGDSRAVDGVATVETSISVRTVHAAWAIVQEHLRHFLALFPASPFLMPPAPEATAEHKRQQRLSEDAAKIMLHFHTHCRARGESSAPKSAVMCRTGLYAQRFDAALISLVDNDQLVTQGSGKKTRLYPGSSPYPAPGGPSCNSTPAFSFGV